MKHLSKRINEETATRLEEMAGVSPDEPHFNEAVMQLFLAVRAGKSAHNMSTRVEAIARARRIEDERAGRAESVQKRGLVYYVRIDPYIKIGTTVDLNGRLNSYPPSAVLLVTEPGGVEVEAQRLAQFRRHLAARREWFHPHPDLLAHIDTLVSTRGSRNGHG